MIPGLVGCGGGMKGRVGAGVGDGLRGGGVYHLGM